MTMPSTHFEPDHEPPERAHVLRLVRPPSSRLPGHQRRTCTRCGAHTWFQLEDPAGWYTCTVCGAYA